MPSAVRLWPGTLVISTSSKKILPAAGGMCVVLIEHNVAFLMDLADIVTVIQSGKVIAEGTPKEVQKNERVLEAYLGNTDFSKELA